MLCVYLLSLRLRGEPISREVPSQATSRWLALPFPDQTVARVDKSLNATNGPKAGQYSDDKTPISSNPADDILP